LDAGDMDMNCTTVRELRRKIGVRVVMEKTRISESIGLTATGITARITLAGREQHAA